MNEGLGHILAYRICQVSPNTISVAASEHGLELLAKRSFREVVRVSGLIQENVSGQEKNQRLLQMSSGLLYDVFEKYEPHHPLVEQAKNEVRSQQLNLDRLIKQLEQMKKNQFIFKTIQKLSPFAFPLFIERARSRITTEKLDHRIRRFQRHITEDT